VAEKQVAVVDGANIAYVEQTADGKPKVSNLVAVRKALEERGFHTIVIVDAALRYEVDDPDQLEGLLNNHSVRQAPADTEADYFVLETAADHDGLVVSNDSFDEWRAEYPWIEEQRLPLMIVDGEVELYGPVLEKAKHERDAG
jgi:hypothetical protein